MVNGNGHVSRDDIDRAAALVFRREGFRGSTMQQIADEVGLHKTSLYHHITSKESLLTSISQTAIDHSLAEIERIAVDDDLSPTGKLRRAMYMQVMEVTNHTDQVAVFTMYLDEIQDEAVRAEFVARRDRYGELMQQIIADCIGVPAASDEARMTSFGVLGMCNWMLFWYHPKRHFGAEELAGQFADMAVAAVLGRTSRSS